MTDDIKRLEAAAASEESHDPEGVAEVVALDPTVGSAAISGAESTGPALTPNAEENAGDEAAIPGEPTRNVVIVPGQFQVNPTPLVTEVAEFGELNFANAVFGGSVFLDRSQLIAIGSQMLQLAGLMQRPKDKPVLVVPAGADVEGLVGPDGVTPL